MKEKNLITSPGGFTYEVEDDALDNLEIFERVRMANEPGVSSIIQQSSLFEAFKMVIGPEQDEKLKAFLKERDGKVKTTAYAAEVNELFSQLGKSKKK